MIKNDIPASNWTIEWKPACGPSARQIQLHPKANIASKKTENITLPDLSTQTSGPTRRYSSTKSKMLTMVKKTITMKNSVVLLMIFFNQTRGNTAKRSWTNTKTIITTTNKQRTTQSKTLLINFFITVNIFVYIIYSDFDENYKRNNIKRILQFTLHNLQP